MTTVRPRRGGPRRRLALAFALVTAVAAGVLAIASYLLVREARLQGSLDAAKVAAREDLNLAATISYPLAASFVRAYEQRGTHAVLIFPGGRRVASDATVDPPLPAALRGFVAQGQLGYQRVTVAGQPYLVLAARVPQSAAELYLFFPEQDIAGSLARLRDGLAAGWLGAVVAAALIGYALDAKIAALSAAQARERRFTANVAHELRTPVTALVAEASVLTGQADQLPEAARRPVELLIADVGRLKKLVGELLEISRLDARSEPLQQGLVDVVSLVTGLIAARGWQDKVTVAGAPLALSTDPRRLERILTNLVENAVEHSGRNVRVLTGCDGGRGIIEVADDGPGIPADKLPFVFERFYKGDSARSGAGSGLGLAIALENARLLGGDVVVSSDVRLGSAFRLTLPLRGAGMPRPRPAAVRKR